MFHVAQNRPKREETNKNSRSIVITPFDGDRKNYAKYKSSIVDFITKCFNDLLGADPPNVESVVVWKDRPSATVIFSEYIARDKLLGAVKPNFNTFNGVKILPLFTEAQRMNHKRKVQEREDALFERLSNKRKVGVGEQQKGTK
uniref:Uncharacterized protein n=1 Tax=Ditylenchus dipsaci TaxID=166011 RepID=A0A915DJM4_9BILA